MENYKTQYLGYNLEGELLPKIDDAEKYFVVVRNKEELIFKQVLIISGSQLADVQYKNSFPLRLRKKALSLAAARLILDLYQVGGEYLDNYFSKSYEELNDEYVQQKILECLQIIRKTIPSSFQRERFPILGFCHLLKIQNEKFTYNMQLLKERKCITKYDSDEGDFFINEKGINFLQKMRKDKNKAILIPSDIKESLKAFLKDHPNTKKTAFIMMRFEKSEVHKRILKAIKKKLQEYNIVGLRADEKQYHDELFSNVKTYLYGSGFGIAVYEQLENNSFNPNVSLEVGYMFGLNKDVCILKDNSLSKMHSDLIGRLYKSVDIKKIDESIDSEIGKWIEDKGLI